MKLATGMLCVAVSVVSWSVGLLSGWHIHRTAVAPAPVVAEVSPGFAELAEAQRTLRATVAASVAEVRALKRDLQQMREVLIPLRAKRVTLQREADTLVAPTVQSDDDLMRLARAQGFTKVVIR